MKPATTSTDATRYRLLEGFLLRMSRRRAADRFILRGGMLLRHWFRPVPRSVDDIDLIAPFSAGHLSASRLISLLADEAGDGVVFDAEAAYPEEMQLDTGPGKRVFATGMFGGIEAEFHIDITFGPQPRPNPVFEALPLVCGEAAPLWMCRPEAIVGHKIQGLWNRGVHGWRPKDLEDLRLLLAGVPMNAADLRWAIVAYHRDVDATAGDVRTLFGPQSWWGMKRSAARWQDFVRASQRRDVPPDLATVIADIAGYLGPLLEDLP